MTSREAFLERVRQSVREGNRAGANIPLPERGSVGYQGGGPDPVDRFCTELLAAGGVGYVSPSPEDAVARVLDILQDKQARKVLLSREALPNALNLAQLLRSRGYEVTLVDSVAAAEWKESFFQADVGISGVSHLIAETGTVVMMTSPEQPRSVSLLPPVHIALARRDQLLPDLFDLFDLFSPLNQPPACLTLITGPSKTGDIELRLVTGVHGPGEVHVIVNTWPGQQSSGGTP